VLSELLAALQLIARLLLVSGELNGSVVVRDANADLWAGVLDDGHRVAELLRLLLQLRQELLLLADVLEEGLDLLADLLGLVPGLLDLVRGGERTDFAFKLLHLALGNEI
jgi:hypothetical protein